MPASHDVLTPISVASRGTNSTNYVTGASDPNRVLAGKNGQFTIVGSGRYDGTASPQTTLNPGAGNFTHDILILLDTLHGLPFTPASSVFYLQTGSSQYVQLPYTYTSTTATTMVWVNIHALTTPTELLIIASYTVYGGSFTIPNGIFKYFLMQQTAN